MQALAQLRQGNPVSPKRQAEALMRAAELDGAILRLLLDPGAVGAVADFDDVSITPAKLVAYAVDVSVTPQLLNK